MFSSCTIIKSESDEHQSEKSCDFYIWDDLDEARNYYQHHKLFLCPACATYTADFSKFVNNHRHHARAFLRPKSTYPRPHRLSSINRPTDVPHMQQYYPTKAMKRQLGGALETLRLSQSTSLRGCHINIEATPFDDDNVTSVRHFIDQHRVRLMMEFHHRLQLNVEYKVQMTLQCNYHRVVKKNGEKHDEDEDKTWFVSNAAVPFTPVCDKFLEDGALRLDEKVANYSSHGSNWTVNRIIKVGFIFTRHEDLCRIAGHSYIPLPSVLNDPKKGLVNPMNKHDNMCFLYAILAVAKYDQVCCGNRHRVANYVHYLDELKFDEFSMPMRIAGIPSFERMNPQYRINVLRYTNIEDNVTNDDDDDDDVEEKEIFKNPYIDLIYRTRNTDTSAQVINLLLLEGERTFHYVGVINLNNLLNVDKGFSSKRIQSHWCTNCLHGFSRQKTLEKHQALCVSSKVDATVFTMPSKDKLRLKFSDLHKTISPAYVVYADFESLLLPNEDSSSNKIQTHMPAAAGYLITNASPDIKSPLPTSYKEFYGPTCIVDFLASLEEQAKLVHQWYGEYGSVEMTPLTKEETDEYNASQRCYLCQLEFAADDAKVHDHNHFTGNYIGAACNECNLARRHNTKSPFLPIVFHNLRGYDMHHIVKHAIDQFTLWNLSCIPQSSEKFLSLTAYIKGGYANLRFIDSHQFLGASLKRLVNNLDAEEDLMLTNHISQLPDYDRTSKGIYPYSFPKSFDDLEEVRHTLPAIDAFYDVLSEQVNVSDEEHTTACCIWRDMGCNSLKDYMMTYLKLDVFLLADVFETFRYTVQREDDGLDPLHFYGIPSLSWSSALKSIDKPLELLDDHTMYQYFERGIRGGMTFVNQHRSTADANTSILYIDINNLYGLALSQKLPCGDFTWIVDDDLLHNLINVQLLTMDVDASDVGYVFEVDIHTPPHLHDKLDRLPPAPISQQPPGSKVNKLLLTHEDKQHYVIHFALLQFYMKLGVMVTKVHRAVSFRQECVFRNFIMGNTQKRASSTTEHARSYYKLKNNSLYGKTVENIRKRKDFRLCNNEKKLVTYASKSTFKRTIEVSDNLIIAELIKDSICLNKPIYVGQAVLDLSKLRMYRLQYVELERYREEFHCQLNIIAGDTDSFFLECKGVDVDEKLLPAMIRDELLDTSNYAKDHPLYSTKFASQIGKFKDECGGAAKIVDAVFLKPKLYSLKTTSKGVVKAKGVMMNQTTLSHDDYVNVLTGGDCRYVKQRRIGSQKHQLFTISSTKLALSCNDDKRQWVTENDSLAYGHYRLTNSLCD